MKFETPSTFESWIFLNLTAMMFFILTWYFDHIFESNRGSSDSALFCLTADYWRCKS